MLITASYAVPPLEMLLAMNLLWVRPLSVRWKESLRSPTIGRFLEFLEHRDAGCVPVNSRTARRWYATLCA